MSQERRYPRKGEFGNPTPICEWCGMPVYNSRGFRRWVNREYGTWCSCDCSAAGQLYQNILGLSMMSIIFIFLVLVVNTSAIVQNFSILLTFGAGLLFLPLLMLYQISNIRLGMRIRDADARDRWGEELIQSEEDFREIHHYLIEFIKSYPANEGISKRVIYSHMSERKIPLREVNVAIRELVGGGFLKALSLSRYSTTVAQN